MLVLSRRIDQAIIVGNVRIVVVDIRDGKVQLGLTLLTTYRSGGKKSSNRKQPAANRS